MSDCEKYLDMISSYADGELEDAAELEAHLETCEECRSLLEAYRGISDAMSIEEDVPENFAAGVMAKVDLYEQNTAKRGRKRNLGIAGRWIGIAACIAVVLVAFPRMPGLGCGASGADAAAGMSAGAVMEPADSGYGGNFGGTNETAMPESSDEYSYTDADDADYVTSTTTESDVTDSAVVEDGKTSVVEKEIGLIVTVYGGEIPEVLLNSDYEAVYFENGDIEYIVPVSVALDIAAEYENVEAESLDTDIVVWARVIITK